MDEKDECVPTVFLLEWPQNVQDLVRTGENPEGLITNSDLEKGGLLLCWLVMEEAAPCIRHKYVGLYCDNSPTVSWVSRMATRVESSRGPTHGIGAVAESTSSLTSDTPAHSMEAKYNRRCPLPVVWWHSGMTFQN